MKLNPDVIAAFLPDTYRLRRYGPKDRSLTCSRPLLFEGEAEMDPRRMYVVNPSFLPNAIPDGINLICVGGRLPGRLQRSDARILHVENTSDVMQVLWDVYAVFDLLDAWDEELRDILEDTSGADLQRFSVAGIRILKNSIGLSDYGLNSLFLCSYENGNIHYREESGSAYSIDNLEGIRDVWRIEQEIQTPYLSGIPGLPYETYCQNIYSFGHFLGCAHISSQNHSFQESDYPLMDHFYGYLHKLAIRYFSTTATGESAETAAMESLLEGRLPRNTNYRQLRPASGSFWYAFRLKEWRNSRYLPHDYMCEQLRMFLPGRIHAFVNGDGIVGLLELPDGSAVDPGFTELLHRMGYLCGLSNPFREIERFPYFHEQAAFVLNLALEQKEAETVTRFGDHVLRYMLTACTGSMPKEVLFPSGLVRLMEYDRQRGSDYVRTLLIYLRNECNASKTAEQLFVHRNSFLKRLERIEKIMDMTLDDADTRLLLRICLRLVEEE